MKQYIIDENQLKDLLRTEQLLHALLEGGLNNWEGFERSIIDYEECYAHDIDYVDDLIDYYKEYKETVITLDDAEELYNELDNISRT